MHSHALVRSIKPRKRILILAGLALVASCGGPDDAGGDGSDGSDDNLDIKTAPARVTVDGKTVDVESDYLPRVVMCENPDASPESMKAQAIAARTYLAYATRHSRSNPTIADGQNQQVYHCERNNYGNIVTDDQKTLFQLASDAVTATKGMVITWNGTVIASFFVNGALRDAECKRGSGSSNERDITLNNGLSGSAVHPSVIASLTDKANRGCMGQRLANCLDDNFGLSAVQILKYFYGEDILVRGAKDDAIYQDSGGVPDPGNVDSTSDTTCDSPTLGHAVQVRACVQSKNEGHIWFQCAPDGSWQRGVDTNSWSGPEGACPEVDPLM
jgi:hypothetical protein